MIVLSVSPAWPLSWRVGDCSPPLLLYPNGKPARGSLLLCEERLSTLRLPLPFVRKGNGRHLDSQDRLPHPWPSLPELLVWAPPPECKTISSLLQARSQPV